MAAYDKRVIDQANKQGDFVTLDDGFVHYMPSKPGALSAHDLRVLSEELDARNAEWANQLNGDLSKPEADGHRQPMSAREPSPSESRSGNLAPPNPERSKPSYWRVPQKSIDELLRELEETSQPQPSPSETRQPSTEEMSDPLSTEWIWSKGAREPWIEGGL